MSWHFAVPSPTPQRTLRGVIFGTREFVWGDGGSALRAASEQLAMLEHFARSATNGRIVLLPDNDDEGESGFKELLWSLAERGLDVRLAWSRRSHGGQFNGQQPEDLTPEDWQTLLTHLARPR